MRKSSDTVHSFINQHFDGNGGMCMDGMTKLIRHFEFHKIHKHICKFFGAIIYYIVKEQGFLSFPFFQEAIISRKPSITHGTRVSVSQLPYTVLIV